MTLPDNWREEFGDAFQGRCVLVTGAGGFIGGHLTEALTALGAEVDGVSLEPDAPNWLATAHYACLDLVDFERTKAFLERLQLAMISWYYLWSTQTCWAPSPFFRRRKLWAVSGWS